MSLYLNVGNLNPAAPYLIANAAKWMLSGNGWRCPTQHYVPGASALFGVMEKWFVSDDYWTFAPRFLLTNWYLTTSGGGGAEAANGNSISIEAVSIQVGINGSPVQLGVNGSTSTYTLADDTEIWTDAPASLAVVIPPRTLCCLRVAVAVPNSSSNISSPYPGLRPMFGDKVEWGTSSLASKVMAGGISTSTPAGSLVYGYTASAMVAQGWDGRPVVLGFGTSIEAGGGSGQSRLMCGAMGSIGPIEKGMDSTYGGAPRLPFANWSVSSGLAAGITGTGANQGLTRRMRALAALPNVPMTAVYSGYGTNDQTGTLSAWQGVMTALWSALKTAFPSCRLIQSTLPPRASSTDGFTSVANQSAQSANWTYPSGSAWGLYNWMKGNNPSGGALSAVIDNLDLFDNKSGGGTRGTWRTDLTDTGWSTTLQASISASFSSFTLGSLPRAGTILSILDGTQEAVYISSVSGAASPFTATCALNGVNAHTSGASVVEKASTVDGTHLGEVIAQFVGDRGFAAAKLAGTFG